MISAILVTDGRERQLAIQVRVMAWPRFQRLLHGLILVKIIHPPDVIGPMFPPLPRDVLAVVVDALATALVAEYRPCHPEARGRP